jgi:hypothetical protein
MRDCSLFQAQISVLVMHVERDSQPLFLLLFFSYFVPQNFFRQILKIFGEKTHVAFCEFFFWSNCRFFQAHQTCQTDSRKNFKNETKEEEEKKNFIASPQRRGVRKKNIKNEIVSRAFFSRRRVLSLSLSSAFVNVARHTFIFPGKISNFKKRTKHVRNAKE